MISINELSDQIELAANSDMAKLPGFRVNLLLGKYFREMNLPVRHLGKINVSVSDSFFDDEAKAENIVKSFVIVLRKIKLALEEEFGEDADQIFVDTLARMSLIYEF